MTPSRSTAELVESTDPDFDLDPIYDSQEDSGASDEQDPRVVSSRIIRIYEFPSDNVDEQAHCFAPHDDPEHQDGSHSKRVQEWAYFVREYREKINSVKTNNRYKLTGNEKRLRAVALLVLRELGGFSYDELQVVFSELDQMAMRNAIRHVRHARGDRGLRRSRVVRARAAGAICRG